MIRSTKKLEVFFYSLPACKYCKTMSRTLAEWLDRSPAHVEIRVEHLDLADHMEEAKEQGVVAAPMVKIIHHKNSKTVTHYVSGLQPDRLVDALNDDVDVWSQDDEAWD